MTVPESPAETKAELLVLAPFRRDGAALDEVLAKAGHPPTVCSGQDALLDRLGETTAVLLLTQEALTKRLLRDLPARLAEQPSWSELPVLLLLDAEQQTLEVLDKLRSSMPRSKLSVLSRPASVVELLTAVEAALDSRRRQWQVRDQMLQEVDLRKELNHRVKNAFANIYAVYHITRRRAATLEQFEADFEGRLSALSRVHDLQFGGDGGSTDLRLLCEGILSPYRAEAMGAVHLAGPPVALKPSTATTLALCLHELATNAVKYGALSVPGGRLTVGWAIDAGEGTPTFDLTWSEAGGPRVQAVPAREGYGTSFIRTAARSGLKGRADFDFHPSGLRFTLKVDLEQLTSAL